MFMGFRCYANSKISDHLNTKHQVLKDESKSKRGIPDIGKYMVWGVETHATLRAFLATESH